MADKTGYIGRSPADSSVTIQRQNYTAVGIQTSFVVAAGYDVGYLDVFINGSKLVNANDFTASDGQNVILEVPAQSGDTLEFVAYKAFNLEGDVTTVTVGGAVGVSSAGVEIGNADTLNFIGVGNTFKYDSVSKTVDISISGGGSLLVIPTRSGAAATVSVAGGQFKVFGRSSTIIVPV